MKNKTPDQIRRETVPNKRYGLLYGFLGTLAGAVLWFGGWGLLHQEQVKRFPAYCVYAFNAEMGNISLFGNKKHHAGLSADQLRYALLRHGNEDHGLDAEIVQHGWYPREARANPRSWVFYNGNVEPVYSDGPLMVLKWPVTLTLLTCLGSLIWGLVSNYRYRTSIIAGLPFDGSIVTTVDQYNKEVKGDGMQYTVKAWKDR